MNSAEIGKLLKTARQKKSITQQQLATELCVTASAISKWENGKNLPDLEILLPLSCLLDLTLEDFRNPLKAITNLKSK